MKRNLINRVSIIKKHVKAHLVICGEIQNSTYEKDIYIIRYKKSSWLFNSNNIIEYPLYFESEQLAKDFIENMDIHNFKHFKYNNTFSIEFKKDYLNYEYDIYPMGHYFTTDTLDNAHIAICYYNIVERPYELDSGNAKQYNTLSEFIKSLQVYTISDDLEEKTYEIH